MSKNRCEIPNFSETISNFCNFLTEAQRTYTWNSEKVLEMGRLTQDYLHSLELDGLLFDERAKIATQLAKCRQQRREHKDTVQVLEPLVEWLDTEKGKQLFNLLRDVLGKTRKIEDRMGTRVYCPRVLLPEEKRDEK